MQHSPIAPAKTQLLRAGINFKVLPDTVSMRVPGRQRPRPAPLPVGPVGCRAASKGFLGFLSDLLGVG